MAWRITTKYEYVIVYDACKVKYLSELLRCLFATQAEHKKYIIAVGGGILFDAWQYIYQMEQKHHCQLP